MQALATSVPSEGFRELIAELDVIIWTADLPRHFTLVSGGAERILGYPVQQWLADPNFWSDHLHPDDRERITQACQAAVNDGTDYKIEYRMLSGDGRSVWLSETAHLLKDESGSSRQLAGVMVDITDRKLREQAFEEQQLRYEQMAENIQELFWMIEFPTLRAIYVNSAFEAITGYTPESLLQSPLSYREIIHVDDRAWVFAQLAAAERTGTFDEQFRIVRADGTTRWVSVRGFPVRDQAGKVYRLAGVVQDVTGRRDAELALRESEDRYRDLVEHSQDLLCTHDLQGRILSCNPAPARLLGYSVEEMLRIPMRQLIAPEVRELFGEYLEQIQRDGFAEGLLVLVTRTGERRIWQYRNTLRADGVPVPIVRGMAQDVTERLHAERALRKSEDRLRVAVKNSRVMVSTQNRNLHYTWVYNPLLAWAEQDCLDKSDEQLLHPEDAYRVKAAKQWVLDTGTGSRTGLQITFHERKYYLDLTVEPLLDSSASVVGITCATTDITELHDKAERLQLLLEINSALISKLELPELLQALSSCIHRLFKQDFLSISVCDPPQPTITNYPLDAASLARLTSLEVAVPAARSLAARALESGEIELFGPTDISSEKSEFLFSPQQPLRSLACIPIESSRGRLATLNLGSNQESAFSPADFYLMRQLGVVVSAAMNNADAFAALRRLHNRLAKERVYLAGEIQADHDSEIIGESPVSNDLRVRAEAVARVDSTVILCGETGVGKHLLARAIHRMSDRGEHTFVRFNCAAVPKQNLERELFGYEAEASAGKSLIKMGRLDLADNSTLFLEHVTELTPELQQKLLRLLEERQFERADSRVPVPIDVRLIVSTSESLENLVREGAFRPDLYYELNVFPVHIPPLREHRDDIPSLAQHFVNKYARRMRREIPTIPTETLSALTEWHWPGNVRELENFIERSVILTKGTELEAPLWELRWRQGQPLTDVLAKAEREYIIRTLQETDGAIGGRDGAAARLGLKPTALKSKLQQLGITNSQDQQDLPS
jgi:formate hydrogenlyase transcriptional activator